METYNLFDENSQCFFYNLKIRPVQSMLDFDYLSRREPSIAAIIHPGRNGFHKCFFGGTEILIPIYDSLNTAILKHSNVDSLINFASFRSAYKISVEALQSKIKVVTIVAEGIPERNTRKLVAIAKSLSKTIIGPSTVGGIVGGKFRIGHAGGENDNIIKAKLYRPGSIGLVSKSGGMMNEFFNIISRATDGIYEGIAIGGDQYAGSTLLDHILRYETNPKIKMIVVLGEIGGMAEYEIIAAKNKITKPLLIWVSGTCAELFPFEVQFGHAGAKAGVIEESAQAKNTALREAGFIVPQSFELLEETLKKTFDNLSIMENNSKPQLIPERKSTNFTSSISNETKEELEYNGVKISSLVNSSIGDVIGLLWFKKKLPDFFVKFLNLSLVVCADHGPAVSGAHNAIVASRAGKDMISSLCSGLLTIGPRFGGAIDGACKYWYSATNAADFVSSMKAKGKNIPGIGHRVKSKSNPDVRVSLLKTFAKDNFSSTKYLDFALEVEQITLAKNEKLILNVDGCLAALFLDALVSSSFSNDEIKEIIEIGYMNGLFALSRSIGIIGHIYDQKRLKEGLYRHDTKDILYLEK
jgi:succinyl-CoA synthetase alpha subunit